MLSWLQLRPGPVFAVLIGAAVAGCAMGPLASGNGLSTGAIGAAGSGVDFASGDLHGTSCEGLALERQQRQARIAALQPSLTTDLANPPATLMQILQRASTTPEVGTNTYAQIAAERANLDAATTLAGSRGCPPLAQAAKP